MDKNEIIFLAVLIMAYLICTFTLNVSVFVQIIFGIVLLAVLLIAILFKYRKKIENEKISHIADIISIILFVIFVATVLCKSWFNKTLIVDSTIVLLLFLIALFCSWIFKKKN